MTSLLVLRFMAAIVRTAGYEVLLADGGAPAHRGGPMVVDPYALSRPSHIPFHTAAGFTLSLAKQVLRGDMDSVIRTITRNVGLV